jgi:hypothetical protein
VASLRGLKACIHTGRLRRIFRPADNARTYHSPGKMNFWQTAHVQSLAAERFKPDLTGESVHARVVL